jgi:hypothetical protein
VGFAKDSNIVFKYIIRGDIKMIHKNIGKTLLLTILLTSVIISTASADETLQMIPDDSLCVLRINNFENTLSRFDQYMSGISPVPLGTAMMVRGMLAGMLGNAPLTGLNMNGNFTIFITSVKDQPVINILAPVSNFDEFTKNSPNLRHQKRKDVYVMKINDTQRLLIRKTSNYALARFTQETGTRNFIKMAVSLSNGDFVKLASSLAPAESQKAGKEPVWLYINMPKITESFGQLISENIEQAKMMIAMSTPELPAPTQEIMKKDFAKMIGEIKFLSLTIDPQPDLLKINKTVSITPDTETATMVALDSPMIKAMIQTFQAKEPAKMGDQIREISALLPQARNATFAGKYNMIDMIKSSMKVSPLPVKVPDIQSNSSLFYAVKLDNGNFSADIALPKLHAQEITQVAMIMSQQMSQSGFAGLEGDNNMRITGQPSDQIPSETTTSTPESATKAEEPPLAVKARVPGEPLIIEPLVGIGDVKFGMNIETMKQILGEPKSSTGRAYLYFDDGLSIVTAIDDTIDVIYCGDKRGPDSPLVKNCKHKTGEGIAMGSGKQKIIEIYGKPDSTYTHSDKTVETLTFREINAKFTLKNDKLVQMLIRKP